MKREGGLPEPPPADIAEHAQDFVGRGWVGDLIAGWLAGSAPVLLITGEPGAGKTMVAAQAVATSRGEALLGSLTPRFLNAAHFCRQFQSESINPVSILEHVGGQLAETVPGYLEILGLVSNQTPSSIVVGQIDQQIRYAQNSTVIGVQIRIESPDPRIAYHRLIRGPLQRLREEKGFAGDVVVLMDGLDETVEGATGTPFAARLAQELRQEVPGLRLCLTSRPGKAADRLNEIADQSGGCERIDLTASRPAGVDDVYAYVERRLSRLISDQPSYSLAGMIADAAQGNFLYARAAVDDAVEGRSRVNGRLQFPTGLAGIYAAYLDRELSLDDAAWEQRYRPILGALAQSLEGGLSARHLESIHAAAMTAASRRVLPDSADRLVEFRMARQRRLMDADGLHLTAVIEESGLRRPVGGADVVRGQLAHLVEIAELPNVTLQVLPLSLGVHSGMAGRFTVLSFRDVRSIAFVEHREGGVYVQDQQEVHGYVRSADSLRGDALGHHDSVSLITSLIKEVA